MWFIFLHSIVMFSWTFSNLNGRDNGLGAESFLDFVAKDKTFRVRRNSDAPGVEASRPSFLHTALKACGLGSQKKRYLLQLTEPCTN